MKQTSKFKTISKKHVQKKKNHLYNNDNSFIGVECPYCESNGSFIFWSQSDTVGHCPQCSKNWVEYQGMIWTF
ncbi:hypothetical protein [Nitrosopumilus piranensis]|uniref:Uncharacterized protein n=1 Tax=Nitrosopumilus piranensis TaxID=1582439 RepID=A0A0C5BZ89_9ARCH|nr:hypothetical protein [Nitrosopumilus piranensis]AJM92315.1 hypothetical protein NPIRD3C_1103 [Nitrosopumilus piranensis]